MTSSGFQRLEGIVAARRTALRLMLWLILWLSSFGSLPGSALAQSESVPQPLTLEDSLRLAADSPLAQAFAADAASANGMPGEVADHAALLVTRRFFELLLADERYLVDNELMTVAFLKANRYLQKRTLFDEYTELEVAEKQRHYQDRAVAKQRSEHERFGARVKLAHALGLPDAVIKEVALPDIGHWLERAVPDYAEYLGSLGADTLMHGADGDRARMSNVAGFADELTLREHALDGLQALKTAHAERRAAAAQVEYRDLYLDRSRARYDMEIDSDLGAAQANLADALWRLHQAEYDIVLAWMNIDVVSKALSAATTDNN